jgi:methylisocitrate lyase
VQRDGKPGLADDVGYVAASTSLGMTKRLRALIAQGSVALPGVPNAAIARQVERAGFEAVYISGAGLANMTAGLPDIGLLTLTEVAGLAGWIADAVTIPAIVDADTGFGGAENAARTICELEAAGLAGCHLEDQEFPKRCGHLAGKSLVTAEEMVEKLQAAVAAKRDRDFLVIARTDARSVEDFSSAVQRAQEYVAAGADAIFPEALQTANEFRDFAREVKAPLLANMTEFGKSPLLDFQQLQEFGYKLVIYPQSALRVALKTTNEFLRDLKTKGTQRDWLGKMQTREELYELLEYDPAEMWGGYDAETEEKTSNVERPTSNAE